YTYKPGVWFWISLILLICASAMIIVLKFPKHDRPTVKEISIRAGVIVSLVICVLITFNNGLLYKSISGVGWDYNKNVIYAGYMPYFLSNMNSIKKVTVEGYEAQLADEAISTALDQMGSDDTGSCKHPNIIIIQNEAFADLSVAYDIETNRDYMPFIHSMNENTRKGYLNMSVTGGPTANTEFEILMRTTLNFLPYGSVPYTQYVDADLPSIAQVLKNQPLPYHTVAYHSYYSSGYRRISVYDHLGFDESYFEDKFRNEFPESDLIRSLMSDSANYRRVEEFYEDFRSSSDEPWFCFNVTIQNHGGYTVDYQPDEDDNIYVTNFDAPDSVNEYLSLVKVSDDAFRELIEYFEQCDEPTIIAMYGDHQPKMDHEANTVLDEHPSTIGNSRTNSYYVPYVIWANFDIEESDTLGSAHQDGELNTLSTNYFASTVFDIAGIQLTDYDRYLIDLHERIPAITAIGIWDSDGNYYSVANQTPYADELNGLEMVQYNLIFDDNNRLTDRFE
ncbi:MAG: LTA synthase family protein, partial [Clostridiales bacterium]|nr:LTA synthase family protein [Clostridiales bacterium]